MKRMLSIAVVTVGVTGLFGTGWVLAQSQSMSMSGSSGSGSSGSGAGMGSVGGWSLAPEPSTKKKVTGAKTSAGGTAVATTSRTPSGAWSVEAPPAPASKLAAGTPAPAVGTAVASNAAHPVLDLPDAKSAKIEVKNLDNGVTITFTSSDRATAARLQKMGQAMRLMHEAMSP